jgi:hypothetical protein
MDDRKGKSSIFDRILRDGDLRLTGTSQIGAKTRDKGLKADDE